MVDDFYHLDKLGLVYDHRFSDVNFLDYGVFDSFDDGFLNNLSYNFHHLMHDWNLDDFLHFHWDLFDHFYDFFDNNFHRLDDLFSHQLFSDHLHFLDLHSFVHHFDYFLDNCRHFNNLLYSLNHWHDFLHDTIHWLVNGLDMVVHFKGFAVFNGWYHLFNNAFNDFNPHLLNDFLYNSVSEDWHFDNFLHNPFHWHDLLFYHFDFLRFLLNVIDHSLHFNDSFHLNDLLDDCGDFNYFCHFLGQVNDFLYDCGHLNNLVDDLFQRDYFFNDLNLDSRNFKGHINDFFDLLESFDFDDFFDFFCNRDDDWYFDYFLYDFLYDFFDLLYFLYGPEHFEDIFDVNKIGDFGLNHGDDGLINFESQSSLELDFMQFFHEGFDEDSEMELDFAGLF